jgi:hypothetical protein
VARHEDHAVLLRQRRVEPGAIFSGPLDVGFNLCIELANAGELEGGGAEVAKTAPGGVVALRVGPFGKGDVQGSERLAPFFPGQGKGETAESRAQAAGEGDWPEAHRHQREANEAVAHRAFDALA